MPASIAAMARRMGSLPWSALPREVPAVDARLGPWATDVVDVAWQALGRPDPLAVVVEGAARPDPLAARSGRALRLLLVGGEGPDPASEVLGPLVAADDADDDPVRLAGIGPLVAGVIAPPAGLAVAVVVAVGVLGGLPADRFVVRDGAWWEARLVAAGEGVDEVLLPADPARRPAAAPASGAGAAVRDPAAMAGWLQAARRLARAGVVVVADAPDVVAALPPGSGLPLPPPPTSFRLAVTSFTMGGPR